MPHVHFDYQLDSSLPRMAWCARVGRNGVIVVHHGAWVETDARYFVEGAWERDFAAGELDVAYALMGSGARLMGDGVVFSTPSHVLESLFSASAGDELLLSNSLAFLLTQLEDDVDLRYPYYQPDLLSVMRGVGRHVRDIPTRDGRAVRLHTFVNVLVTPSLELRELAKPSTPAFRTYEEYVGTLTRVTAAIARNAASPERARTHFDLLGTISSGYDSPACAVIAQTAGCTRAITFTKARDAFEGADDSGTEIGHLLGLEVLEFDRAAYLELGDFPEAEFVASGTGGEEVVLAPLASTIEGHVLVTGYLGDSCWDVRPRNLVTDLRMGYPGGLSLGEFRLRAGFVHFPLPFVGYAHRPQLQRIASSTEMTAWRVGTEYDRPIPRRLVEERGVPRHLFGQAKKAVTQPLLEFPDLASVMSSASYRDFVRFADAVPEFRGIAQRLTFAVLHALHEINVRINWRLEAASRALGRTIPTRTLLPSKYQRQPGRHARLFHWGMSKLAERYRTPVGPAVAAPEKAVASSG